MSVHSLAEVAELVKPLTGLVVSLPWKGYGSAIFFELGKLVSERHNHQAGEARISIEWDWRVECGASVLYGSSNTGPEIRRGVDSFQGTTIASVYISGDVPELAVSFSNGHVLRSMVMRTGNPEWSIRLLDGRYAYAHAGQLLVGKVGVGAEGLSEEEKAAFARAEGAAGRWGTPLLDPIRGHCQACSWFVPIDGQGHLLDYGVCTSSQSPFDGKSVKRASGCPAYWDGT